MKYSNYYIFVSKVTRDGSTAEFQANYDGDSDVYVGMPEDLTASYLRLVPLTWNSAIALRWQVHGCSSPG